MLDFGDGDNQINSVPAADSVRHDTACSATACDEPESEEMLSPSRWAVASSKASATVEVPVQFMEMLVDMWQQRQETRGNKAERGALTAALAGKQLLQEHVDLDDFETGCSVTTTAPSSPDISEACSVRSSSSDAWLSAKDVELIKMLRAALGGAVPSGDCDARAPPSRRPSMAGVTRQLSASAGSYSLPSPSPFFPVVSRQVSGAVSSFPFPDSAPTSLVRTTPVRPTAQVSHSLPLLSPGGVPVPCCCPSPRVPQMLIPIMPEARCAGRAVPTLQMRSVAVTTTTTTVHQFLAVC